MRRRMTIGHAHVRGTRLLIVGTVMGTVMVGTVIVTPFAWAHQGLSADPAVLVMGSGTLTSPNPASKAITYNPDLAPIGAAMTATLIPTSEGSTRADLTILGFPPTRSYVVDAHTKPCGITAAAAGPLFQDQAGTAATSPWPSSDARRAKPATGIRLAVRTDTVGTGTSHTTVPFALTDQVPRSVVLRIGTQTATGPNQADTTGARIACLTLSRK